jgi:hypothetical protein
MIAPKPPYFDDNGSMECVKEVMWLLGNMAKHQKGEPESLSYE